MFDLVVKCAGAIEVFSGFGDLPSHKKGTGGHSMPDSQREYCILFTREREELHCEVERRMAVKRCKVPDPDAI
jgi:hypothetical protein